MLCRLLTLICIFSMRLAAQMVNFDLNAPCRIEQQEGAGDPWDYFGPMIDVEVCNSPITFINNTSATWFYAESPWHVHAGPELAKWVHYGTIPPFSYIQSQGRFGSTDKYFVFATSLEHLKKALRITNGSRSGSWQNALVLQAHLKKNQPQENIIAITGQKPEKQSFITGTPAASLKTNLLKKLKQVPAHETNQLWYNK
jgi:hypothetical protein